MARPSCSCSANLTHHEYDLDVSYCALGHRVTGMQLVRGTKGVLHLYEGQRVSGVDELKKAVEANFLTQEEGRLVALEMFPAAKQIAEARRIVERAAQ